MANILFANSIYTYFFQLESIHIHIHSTIYISESLKSRVSAFANSVYVFCVFGQSTTNAARTSRVRIFSFILPVSSNLCPTIIGLTTHIVFRRLLRLVMYKERKEDGKISITIHIRTQRKPNSITTSPLCFPPFHSSIYLFWFALFARSCVTRCVTCSTTRTLSRYL